MSVIVAELKGRLRERNNRITELEAQVAELQQPKYSEPGACGLCGMNTSTRNPHPEAGNPVTLCEVGAVFECIPCLVKSRHEWAKRANKSERELQELRESMPKLLEEKYESTVRMLANSSVNCGRSSYCFIASQELEYIEKQKEKKDA